MTANTQPLRWLRRPAARRSPPGNTPDAENIALHRDQGAWLLATVALTLAFHLPNLPLWAAILCPLLLAWRGWRLWQGKIAPPRWLLLPIAIAAAVGVHLSYGYFLGKAPGLTFLALLLSLKLLETHSMRDIRAVVLLCLFLQFGLFFNDQSLPVALAALIATVVALGSQISLSDPVASTRERLKTSTLLLVQGFPFMVMLFLLFPRISPLWGIPNDTTATTGLSESMSPGTISELILSDDLAFTAEFIGPPPPPPERYWRGPVLSRFDGRTWHLTRNVLQNQPSYHPGGPRFDYRIILEPHNQHWLPALDYPAGPVQGVSFAYDFQTLSRSAITNRAQFSLSAFPRTQVGTDEAPRVLRQTLSLPPTGNPKARALAAELQAGTPEQTVGKILTWLTDGKFSYTLQPPLLDNNSIDFFLFETKMGFCEHFAGAFVFLARAADVPARVVTGYQGGHINRINGTMTVRQSDAHAWAEVWLDGRGWIRVDPTAIIAPQRIDRGLSGTLRNGLPFMLRPEYAQLRQLRDRWEAIANEWNRLVVTFDDNRQQDLLEAFGLDIFSLPKMLGATALVTVLLLAAFYYWALRRRETRDPLDRAWAGFSARLARHTRALARQPAEGPLDYSCRIAAARPAEAEALHAICIQYARLRYRLPATREEIRQLTRAIRALELKKTPNST
jgi:transglutaminase-like putative cysteine protease